MQFLHPLTDADTLESYRHRTRQPQGNFAMNKRQLIDDIRRYNASAQPQFLAQFNEQSLKQYLTHLEGAFIKRTRTITAVRKRSRTSACIVNRNSVLMDGPQP